MAKFKGNLKQLQAHVKQNLHSIAKNSMDLERELAEIMSRTVIDIVYNAYEPKEYERRGANDGLSDPRNGVITSVDVLSGGQVRVVFENIATGNDTLSNTLLVDTIEEGIKENWSNPDGIWSESRPFMKETAERIRQNPETVINAIRKGLVERGFTVNK